MKRLDAPRSAILLVDVQEKLVAAMDEARAARCLRACEQLLVGAEALGIRVVVTEQYPKGLGSTHASLSIPTDATVIAKTAFDATEAEGVLEALAGCEQIVVAGMEAHICVFQTVRALAARNLDVHVAADAVCSRDPDHMRLAEHLYRDCGARVSCAETVLFDWLRVAGGDAFKTISRAIRQTAFILN
ncbi:MAG: isochorismatase family protein [Myxococcota bacterium]